MSESNQTYSLLQTLLADTSCPPDSDHNWTLAQALTVIRSVHSQVQHALIEHTPHPCIFGEGKGFGPGPGSDTAPKWKTEIFADYSAFCARPDKAINGVSPEFADANPGALAESTNRGCWNCSGCSRCSGCSGCSGCSSCSGCSGCSDCSDCSYCSGCSDCSGCFGCSDCSRCSDCSDCFRCSDCSNCSNQHK